jgi:hypothetical protein
MKVISHKDLLSIWNRCLRNGSLRKLSKIEKAFLRASIVYSKIKGKIINEKLIEKIESIINKIGKSLKEKIFERGLEKAWIMLKGKTYKIFPIVRKWINEDEYIIWLGTEIFVSKVVIGYY